MIGSDFAGLLLFVLHFCALVRIVSCGWSFVRVLSVIYSVGSSERPLIVRSMFSVRLRKESFDIFLFVVIFAVFS